MHASTSILIFSIFVALASANGVINLWSGSNCDGIGATGSYVPPADCTGGCVEYDFQSASATADSGYVCKFHLAMSLILPLFVCSYISAVNLWSILTMRSQSHYTMITFAASNPESFAFRAA